MQDLLNKVSPTEIIGTTLFGPLIMSFIGHLLQIYGGYILSHKIVGNSTEWLWDKVTEWAEHNPILAQFFIHHIKDHTAKHAWTCDEDGCRPVSEVMK